MFNPPNTPPNIRDLITDVDLDNYHGARRIIIDGIRNAHRAGCSARAIVERTAGILGKHAVEEYVAALDMAAAVRTALTEAHLTRTVGVSVKGPDRPRGVWVVLTADPSEASEVPAEDFDRVPGMIRNALRDFHLRIDPTQDAAFLEGEPVLVEKVSARTWRQP